MSPTSGKASIGRVRKQNRPTPTNNARIKRQNSGWYSAKATTRRIIDCADLACRGQSPGGLGELLEEHASVGDHMVSRLEAGDHRDSPVMLWADPHFAPLVSTETFLPVDEELAAIEEDGAVRHVEARGRFSGQSHAHERLVLQEPLRVLHAAANAKRAGRGIDEV